MKRHGGLIIFSAVLLVGLVLNRHTPWGTSRDSGSDSDSLSNFEPLSTTTSAEQLRQLEDSAMLARALVYVDAHPVKPDRVDMQRADEHKQWLADLERQLTHWHSSHTR